VAPGSEEAKARAASLVKRIVADTAPVAVHGAAGTIVIWHRATLHSVGANYSGTIRQAIIYDFPAVTAAPLLVSEDGETLNVPDDDDKLESGGDGKEGPGWMAKWSSACRLAAATVASGGGGNRGQGGDVAAAEVDEFNREFMVSSSRLYDEAAGLVARL
jgi:hypothetical protein